MKNRVIAEAAEYLETNYPDDVFTFKSAASPNWSDPYYKVGFYSKKYDDQEVIVYGDPTNEKIEDGHQVYKYYDTYYQYYMKNEAEDYFYNLASPYFGDDVKIAVTFPIAIGFTENVTAGMQFDSYLESEKSGIIVSFCVLGDNSTEYYDKFVESDDVAKVGACVAGFSFYNLLENVEKKAFQKKATYWFNEDGSIQEKSYYDSFGRVIDSEEK